MIARVKKVIIEGAGSGAVIKLTKKKHQPIKLCYPYKRYHLEESKPTRSSAHVRRT